MKQLFLLLTLAFCTLQGSAKANTAYHYDDKKCLTFLIGYDDKGGAYRHERFYWDDHQRLTARTVEDSQGNILGCRCFSYNADGLLSEKTIYGNLTGTNFCPIFLQDGRPLDTGVESHSIRYLYTEKAPFRLLMEIHDNDMKVRYLYDPATRKPTGKLILNGDAIAIRYFYVYNQKGELSQLIIDDGSSEDPNNLTGVTERQCDTPQIPPKNLMPLLPTAGTLPNEHETSSPCQHETTDQDGTYRKYDPLGNLITLTDTCGLTTHFAYNAYGKPIKITYPDGTSEHFEYYLDGQLRKIQSRDGSCAITTYDTLGRPLEVQLFDCQGNYRGSQTATYNAFHITSYTDTDGHVTLFTYDEGGHILEIIKDPLEDGEGMSPDDYVAQETAIANASPFSLENISQTLWSASQSLKNAATKLYTEASKIKEKLSIESDLKAHLDELALQMFGKFHLNFSGYYTHEQEIGVYGNGEFNDKIRVSFINGILNVKDDHLQNLELFSQSHGGVNIHYIFHPTEGWTRDILMCVPMKFGYVTEQAKELSLIWRHLIGEMGGTEGGGTILHYSHSIGTADTYAAGMMMTPAEQKMIKVVTIGSPTMIPQGGFKSVTNYTSYQDGVSMIGIMGFFGSLINPGPDTNVIFIGNPVSPPLVDHPLATETYTKLIQDLGQEFQNTYSREK